MVNLRAQLLVTEKKCACTPTIPYYWYVPNWSEKVFAVSKIKNTVPWIYFVSDLSGEKITGSFYEKELQKTSQKEVRIEKVLKRKGEKL